MNLFKKAKDVASKAGSAVAEKIRERYSQKPEYIFGRSLQYSHQAMELEEKAKVAEARARIQKAEARGAQSNATKAPSMQGSKGDKFEHLFAFGGARKNGGKTSEANYDHILGKPDTFGKNKLGLVDYSHITGKPKKGMQRDPYAHLFGK